MTTFYIFLALLGSFAINCFLGSALIDKSMKADKFVAERDELYRQWKWANTEREKLLHRCLKKDIELREQRVAADNAIAEAEEAERRLGCISEQLLGTANANEKLVKMLRAKG